MRWPTLPLDRKLIPKKRTDVGLKGGTTENRMYPPTFYNRVMIHANKEPRPLVTADLPRTLLDLGCGPGLSTFPLVPWFERVIAVDPSEGMIAAAKDIQVGLRESGEIRPTKPVVEFIVGRADNLDQVADASVDFVIAGTRDLPLHAAEILTIIEQLKPCIGFRCQKLIESYVEC